jgi:hypothetical protein
VSNNLEMGWETPLYPSRLGVATTYRRPGVIKYQLYDLRALIDENHLTNIGTKK